MKPRFFVLSLLSVLCACATANVAIDRRFDFARIKRVAVIGFTDYPRVPGSGDVVAGAFEQALLAAGYDVIERDEVAKVLQERRFNGSLDPKTAKDLGGALGVDALLFGRITDLARSRDRLIKVDVVDDRTDPVYVRRTRRVQQPDGSWAETSQQVVTGYRTRHILRKEPRAYTTDGRLGVSARLVYVPTGGVAWSGSDSASVYTFEEGARGLADDILKAVKSTWPASSPK